MALQQETPRIVVVGAGIAGLTAAFRLQQAGAHVAVLERAQRELVGGRMASVEREGFHIDLGGPLLARRYRTMLSLIEDLGATDQVLPASDQVAVLHHGVLRRGRTGTPWRLLRSGLLHAAPPRDRLRLVADLRRFRQLIDGVDMSSAASQTESAADYARRRGLANDATSHVLGPLVATMSLASLEDVTDLTPFMMLALFAASCGLFTFSTGSGFLPRLLAQRLPITYGAEVQEIVEIGDGVRLTWQDTDGQQRTELVDGAIVAVPPPQLAKMLPQLPTTMLDMLRSAMYPRLVQVTFCLDQPTAETAPVVYTSTADVPDVACFILQHNLSPRRVPSGTGMVTTYLRAEASHRWWESDSDAIKAATIGAIRSARLFGELDNDLLACHVDRIWPSVRIRPPGSYGPIPTARVLDSGRIALAGADLLSHSTTIGSLDSGETVARRMIKRFKIAEDREGIA